MAKVRVKKELARLNLLFDLRRKKEDTTLTEGDKTKWEMVTDCKPTNIKDSHFEIYKKTVMYSCRKLCNDTYEVKTYRISNRIDTSRPTKEEVWTLTLV